MTAGCHDLKVANQAPYAIDHNVPQIAGRPGFWRPYAASGLHATVNAFKERRSRWNRSAYTFHAVAVKFHEGFQKAPTTLTDLSSSGLRAARGRRDSHGAPATLRRGRVLYDIQEWFDEVNGHGKYDGGIVFACDFT